jgi:DNA-binding NtrC family response regulator
MTNTANMLIVDDAEVVRLSHFRSLTGADFNAEVARDGLEALHMMEQRHFDVVFLDIKMPELDGISVLKKIKQKWPECEVVMITGYPTIETAKEAVRLGAYHYLVKPVGPVDVVQAANDALNHKRWALRTEGPVRQSVETLNSRPWLDELPTHIVKQIS